MGQFELSTQDYSFSLANSLACEGAFYRFADKMASFQPSDPNAPTPLSTFAKLINQVAGSLHAFCQLSPIQEGSQAVVDFLNTAHVSIMRGESNGLPYLVFKSCIQDDPTKTCEKSVLTLAMKNDYSWEKSLSGGSVPSSHFDVEAEKTNLNKFLANSRNPPSVIFDGFKMPISFLGKGNVAFNNQCESKILSRISAHGISPKVSHFILQTLGGISALCNLPKIPCKSETPDLIADAFYATPSTIFRTRPGKGQIFEVGYRLCEVISGLQPSGVWKDVCASDTHYVHETVKKLQKTLGEDFFKGRSSVPFFLFAKVDEKLRDVAIRIYSSDILRPASIEDLSSLADLSRGRFSFFPSLRGNLVRISVTQVHLDQSFNDEEE